MRKPTILFGFLAMVLLTGAARAQERLTQLLGFIPMDAVSGGIRTPVTYADVAELRAASLLDIPLLDRLTWSAEEQDLAAVARALALPDMLQNYVQHWSTHRFATTADYLGFAWRDIGRTIGFGMPPDSLVVITGTPAVTDAPTIDAALTARGFAAEERAGYPFWWRLEDNALNMQNRDPADPLRGHLGGSARAGLVDGAFVATANWPSLDGLLAVRAGDQPSLAQSPDFIALAHALDQPVTGDGVLLQAYLLAGAFEANFAIESIMRDMDEEEIADVRARLLGAEEGPRTPRYSAFALADRQEGERTVGVIALVYTNREDAELATQTVPGALSIQESLRADQPFAELLPYDVATSVVEPPDGARYVAVIALSTELPPRENPIIPPATPFRRLVQMLYQLDLGPIAVAD